MDGPRDCHTKWNKPKINIIWYHLYMESKKKMIPMNLFTQETHIKQMFGYQSENGGGINQQSGLKYLHYCL